LGNLGKRAPLNMGVIFEAALGENFLDIYWLASRISG
jgi:hypothetical protein